MHASQGVGTKFCTTGNEVASAGAIFFDCAGLYCYELCSALAAII